MFLGTHQPRLDDKGRLALPARFRDALSEGIVLSKGAQHCLFVFPIAEFQRLTDSLAATSLTDRAAQDYQRVLFASASDEVPDRQGRVRIPASLRAYAGLDKECVVIGANTRVEIWASDTWTAYLAEHEPDFAGITTEVVPAVS